MIILEGTLTSYTLRVSLKTINKTTEIATAISSKEAPKWTK
jgi:hypothetical protein